MLDGGIIRIREGDEWKGAIVTNRGLFELMIHLLLPWPVDVYNFALYSLLG